MKLRARKRLIGLASGLAVGLSSVPAWQPLAARQPQPPTAAQQAPVPYPVGAPPAPAPTPNGSFPPIRLGGPSPQVAMPHAPSSQGPWPSPQGPKPSPQGPKASPQSGSGLGGHGLSGGWDPKTGRWIPGGHGSKGGGGWSSPLAGALGLSQPTGPVHVGDAEVGLVGGFHRKLKDCFIGYPEYFADPPLGASVNEPIAIQRSAAELHKFTLYRSDFLPGTDRLSPSGASRLNRIAAKVQGWLGPLVVEWTPEDPALGEARKFRIVNLLAGAGLPVGMEKVVIGPASSSGLSGIEADNQYNVSVLNRYIGAPPTYTLSPSETSDLGGGGGS